MEFRLAHFSDIHITEEPSRISWRDLLGKRAIGWVNLRFLGRYAQLSDAARITEAFVRDITEISPDHILFTGDVTGLSLPSEFEAARRILDPLIDPGRITGIPGNHDVYVRAAVREGLYERHFGADWSRSDEPAPPPCIRRLGDDIALICLEDSRPSAWHDSSGRVGPDQLRRLEEILQRPDISARKRIVALHYGPLRADGSPDSYLHGLRDGRQFLEIVDRAGVDLVVHGHLHHRFILPRSESRPVPIANPGSLTHSRHARAYHLYRISDRGLEIDVRRYKESTNSFRSKGN